MNSTSKLRSGELIGLEVKIVESRNRFNTGKKGKVVDETRNMLVLKDDKGKTDNYIKEENTFEFDQEGKKIVIKGLLLMKRPEDRIK
jgi:ribonuclease P protein subunit POP4|tara:strand:+ start:124 stop:384 length:261 start_codon:yes stop_codon:yes gene_type:complete